MRNRCGNPNDDKYSRYGGRGISVCDEWTSFGPFRDWAFSHGYREGLSIDRIDNDGNYCPENCRWGDRLVQANNTSANHYIKIGEETRTIAEWAREKNISADLLWSRICDLNWEPEKAISTPVREMKNNPGAVLFSYNGKTQSVGDWAKEYGLCYSTLVFRIFNCGWPIERALETPVKHWERNDITFRGKTQSFHAWAKELGIAQRTLRNRLFRSGWDVEKAFTTPVNKNMARY